MIGTTSSNATPTSRICRMPVSAVPLLKNTPFVRDFALQCSSRNSYAPPVSVLWQLISPNMFFSGGVFLFTDTGISISKVQSSNELFNAVEVWCFASLKPSTPRSTKDRRGPLPMQRDDLSSYNCLKVGVGWWCVVHIFLERTKGAQGMGIVSNNWFDRDLLSVLCMFKPWCRLMFKPPSLGPP